MANRHSTLPPPGKLAQAKGWTVPSSSTWPPISWLEEDAGTLAGAEPLPASGRLTEAPASSTGEVEAGAPADTLAEEPPAGAVRCV